MQTLIDLLQANRPLSIMEYDRLIRYLSDRRDRQANEDARAGPSGAAASQSYMKGKPLLLTIFYFAYVTQSRRLFNLIY